MSVGVDRTELLKMLSARIVEDRAAEARAQKLGEIKKRWSHAGRAAALTDVLVMLGGTPPPILETLP